MMPENIVTREQSFPAAIVVDADATQDLTKGRLSTTIAMQGVYLEKAMIRRQIVRPEITDRFNQGNSGGHAVEQFNQIANRLLDILLVIDNSHSMREEQQNLANKLAPLLEYIEDADWRIGVVLTDPNSSCMRAVINKTDGDIERAFARAVAPGSRGDNNERGVLTAVRAISGQCARQRDWIREDSTLAVLVVTDEDNCSDGTGCPKKSYATGDYLLNQIAKSREPGLNARIYGLFWHPGTSERQCSTGYNRAKIWSKLVEDTAGTWGSICDADYSDTLRAISKNLQVSLNTKFTLKYVPDGGSVRVFIDGVERRSGVAVQGKVIQLMPAPPEGAVVSINYVHGAVPIQKSFPLRFKPLDGSVTVTIDGATLPNETYSIRESPSAIEFALIPGERTQIAVNYIRDIPLPSQFSIGDVIQPETLLVQVDGVSTTDYTVDEGKGQIQFATSPPDGTTLEFRYTTSADPVLRYALQADSSVPRNLLVVDTQTNQPLGVSYVNGAVVFREADFIEGREITITYDNPQRQNSVISLAHVPVTSTVSAEAGDMVCAGDTSITVRGRAINITDCKFPDDLSAVTIRYKFVAQRFQEFIFEASNLPGASDWQSWKVYVDDQESEAWTRQGNRIKFREALPSDATVRVVLMQGIK